MNSYVIKPIWKCRSEIHEAATEIRSLKTVYAGIKRNRKANILVRKSAQTPLTEAFCDIGTDIYEKAILEKEKAGRERHRNEPL